MLHPLPIPNTIWTDISLDFVEGLPKSKGFDTVMVVVHKLSKYAHFIHMAHLLTAIFIAQKFLDNIYKLHGVTETMVSDRDKIFISKC